MKIFGVCSVASSVEISYLGRFFWPAGLSYSRANAVKREKNVTFDRSGVSSVCTASALARSPGALTVAAQRRPPSAVCACEPKMSFATSRFLCALDAVMCRVCERVEPTHDA